MRDREREKRRSVEEVVKGIGVNGEKSGKQS